MAILAAGNAKAQGVQLFAVGFGAGPKQSTLEAMASPPIETHALLLPSIEDVRAHFGRTGLCALSGPQAPPPPPSAPLPPSYPSPPSPPPGAPSPPRAPKCSLELELLLVLDRSGSIRQSMNTVLSFARDLVGEFEIGDSGTRVGVVQLSLIHI